MFNKMAKVPNSLKQQVEKPEAYNQCLSGIQANIDSKSDVPKTLI